MSKLKVQMKSKGQMKQKQFREKKNKEGYFFDF